MMDERSGNASERKDDIQLFTEQEVENYLTARLKKMDVLCLKWVCQGHVGIPDRIVLGNHGNVYFVEVKRPRGSHTKPMQYRWRDKLRARGFVSVIVHNKEEVDRFVELVGRDEEKEDKI